MNILVLEFITSVGGVQTVYKNILPHLAEEHNIYFLDPYNNDYVKEIKKISKIEVIDLQIYSKSALGWHGTIGNKIAIILKYGFKYAFYLAKLIKLIKKKKIDLLYVSGRKEIIFAYIISKILGTKYVYHCHGFNSYKDISVLYRWFIENSKMVIAVSRSVQKTLIQAGIAEEIIQIIYNGLNLELARNKCTELQSYVNRDFKVLFVGAIQKNKGIHILIKAVNILLRQGMMISLDIVGEVTNKANIKYKKELLKLSQEVGSERISFLGFQSNVYDFINKASVLVLPSVEESFGMVLIEAMYMSKPVIGSNIGGIPEVIDDGVSGFLFEPKNEFDLANKICLLYNDDGLCKRMGLNGNRRVDDMFTCQIQAEKILNVISKCAE